jgi:hypothetical protein
MARSPANTFRPQWHEAWHKHRPKKKVGFLWSVYHAAVVINTWRGQISVAIPIRCLSFLEGLDETMLHRFHHCSKTRTAWIFSLTMLYMALDIAPINGIWQFLIWQQCVMGTKLPRKLLLGATLWSPFRGSTIWTCWLDRNTTCFKAESWPQQRVESLLWEAFLDHGHTAWPRTCKLIESHLWLRLRFLGRFDRTWVMNPLLCTRDNMKVV